MSDIATEAGVLRDFILAELDGASANITQLVEATGAPASTVRWHLMKLKDAGLVESISRGVYRRLEATWYSLSLLAPTNANVGPT